MGGVCGSAGTYFLFPSRPLVDEDDHKPEQLEHSEKVHRPCGTPIQEEAQDRPATPKLMSQRNARLGPGRR